MTVEHRLTFGDEQFQIARNDLGVLAVQGAENKRLMYHEPVQ